MDLKQQIQQRKDSMTHEAYEMAKLRGITEGIADGPQDAFRHTYISAKLTRDEGSFYARLMGAGNEFLNELDTRVKTGWKKGNPRKKWYMDEYNNAVGRNIGERAAKENWSDEQLADEVEQAMSQGKTINWLDFVSDKALEEDGYLAPSMSEPVRLVEPKKAQVWREQVTRLERMMAALREPLRDAQSHAVPTEMEKFMQYGYGPVSVKSYVRGTGKVKAHHRSPPDESRGADSARHSSRGQRRAPQGGNSGGAGRRWRGGNAVRR